MSDADAIDFAQQILEDPDLKKLMGCAEQMKSAMASLPKMPGVPEMPDMTFPEINENNHICDQLGL